MSDERPSGAERDRKGGWPGRPGWRERGRSTFKDPTRSTFDDHLRILLNRRNFNCRKEVDGQLLSQPCWSHCLSYEHEIRKDAYKLCLLQSTGITAALKQVAADNEHKTQHWVQLIAIANSSGASDAKIARLEKEVAPFQVAEDAPQAAGFSENVGASSSGKFLFSAKGVRAWKPQRQPAKESTWQGCNWRKGFWREERWQRQGCDELREDHGHVSPGQDVFRVPSFAQRDVPQVSER